MKKRINISAIVNESERMPKKLSRTQIKKLVVKKMIARFNQLMKSKVGRNELRTGNSLELRSSMVSIGTKYRGSIDVKKAAFSRFPTSIMNQLMKKAGAKRTWIDDMRARGYLTVL